MSNSYNEFAMLYDQLTENVNYEARSEFISSFLIAKGIDKGNLLDLACGTGSFANEFVKLGYDVTGVDYSEDMLTVAHNKLNGDAILVKASMTEFSNENFYDAIICMLDSINHLESENSVQEAFDRAYENLKDGGVFIFDVNTIYKHQKVLGNNTFIYDEDDYYLVWDNELVNDKTVRILLDMFFFNGESYDRYSEEWEEIAYKNEELISMLNKSGFKNVEAVVSPFDENNDEPERIYYICEK